MKTRLLDAPEYKATLDEQMRDVLKTVTNVIDIWPYVAAVPASDLFGHRLVDGEVVERVYRNAKSTYDHVLVVTQSKNVFLVVIVDLKRDAILGHHLLDLNQEYGLYSMH